MPLFQPPVTPLPPGIDLSRQTAVVTGATSGIGLEICRQLLTLRISNLVLAVRNVAKGEEVKNLLLSDQNVKSANTKANVKVLKLDTENYDSPRDFAAAFRKEFQDLHILMLNAGVGTFTKELAATGHEKNLQVNYLSNVLLSLELLPTLEATAVRAGKPTRLTWTGSRAYASTSLASQLPLKPGESVLSHLDNATTISTFARYADSKLLVLLFQLELAKHYTAGKVIVNHFCPGMVDTGMTDVLPIYLRIPMAAVKKLRARSPEKGAWIALHAALVAGSESHGKLLTDKELEVPIAFVTSTEGTKVQAMLWNETIDELQTLVNIPPWMVRI